MKITAMPKAINMGLRLDPQTRQKLDEVAGKNQIKTSVVIQWAINAFIAHAEKRKGILVNLGIGERGRA